MDSTHPLVAGELERNKRAKQCGVTKSMYVQNKTYVQKHRNGYIRRHLQQIMTVSSLLVQTPRCLDGKRSVCMCFHRFAPLRERSRCLTLVRTKVSYRTLHPEHLPQVLPLSDPRLSLALPARGGGAWVARLAFWAHFWSPDRDGPGPLVVRAQTWTL